MPCAGRGKQAGHHGELPNLPGHATLRDRQHPEAALHAADTPARALHRRGRQ